MQYRTLSKTDAHFLTTIFSIPEYELYFSENDTTEEGWISRMVYFSDVQSEIVSVNGKDIGWIMYSIQDSVCSIDIIVLLPSERHHGYGKLILLDLIDRYPEIKMIKLDVQQRNENAVGFYKRMGFQIIGEEYQPVGDESVPYFNLLLQI